MEDELNIMGSKLRENVICGMFDFEEFNNIENNYSKIEVEDKSELSKELYDKDILKNHSAIEIIKLCKKYKSNNKKLNLLTLGPLTNIALAYMLDPSIVDDFESLCIMGGSYSNTGNICSTGEFNFACDNIAAKVVLDNFKNISVYCWEPSIKHLLIPEDVYIKENSSLKFEFIDKSIKKKMEWKQGGIYADLGAAISCLYPKSVVDSKDLYADITIDSSKLKQSRFIISKRNIFKNKDKRKVKIIYDLDIGIFHRLCNEMIDL